MLPVIVRNISKTPPYARAPRTASLCSTSPWASKSARA